MFRASGDMNGMRDERGGALRVSLLGGLRVSVGERHIEDGRWRLRKASALILGEVADFDGGADPAFASSARSLGLWRFSVSSGFSEAQRSQSPSTGRGGTDIGLRKHGLPQPAHALRACQHASLSASQLVSKNKKTAS